MESPYLDTPIEFPELEFVHFDTNEECDEFINYAKFSNMKISHKCCNGLGCGIRNIKYKDLTNLVKEYNLFKNENNNQTKRKNLERVFSQ